MPKLVSGARKRSLKGVGHYISSNTISRRRALLHLPDNVLVDIPFVCNRGIVYVENFFMKSDLRLKPLSVEKLILESIFKIKNHCLCRIVETLIKVKVIVCVE